MSTTKIFRSGYCSARSPAAIWKELQVVDRPEEKASTSTSSPRFSTASMASAASPTLTALVVAMLPSRCLL